MFAVQQNLLRHKIHTSATKKKKRFSYLLEDQQCDQAPGSQGPGGDVALVLHVEWMIAGSVHVELDVTTQPRNMW